MRPRRYRPENPPRLHLWSPGPQWCRQDDADSHLDGLEEPTRGQALVFGVPGRQLTTEQKHSIGYVAEGHHLIGYYTPYKLMATCRDMYGKWDAATFDKLQDLFNIPMNRKIKQLSAGMRAQLNLAVALAMDPELLILDDPTQGLGYDCPAAVFGACN